MVIKEIKLCEEKEDVKLTTYLVNETGDLNIIPKRPAILICPGGGYMGCSDREAEPVAIRFASMGYHAFVLRYSTYCEGKSGMPDITKPIPMKKDRQYPTQIREVGRAMLYIREHAREWNVDADKIALCGFSAGAHLSGLYGVNWNKPVLTDFFKVDEKKLRPAAMILGYMPSDYIFMKKYKMPEFFERYNDAVNQILTGTATPDDETRKLLSPARLVDENTPPAFLWSTAADEMVPIQNTLRMAHALADHKIPFEVHIFEEGHHGLGLADQSSAESRQEMDKDAAQWVELARRWIEKRFALDLPEQNEFEKMAENI